MAQLVANECAKCRRPVGYVAKGTFTLPTFCVLCASDKETMKDWGHKIAKSETKISEVLLDYRFNLDRMDIAKV